MNEQTPMNESNNAALEDDQVVLFQRGNTPLQPGETQLHGLREFASRLFGRSIKDVKSDWEKISKQVSEMIASTVTKAPEGFSLDEVTISLGFSAQGKLVFIAEAGVEASVEIKFRRP
jgi:hypothetical protein